LLLHATWQLWMAASRVAALVLFASVYQAWVILVAGEYLSKEVWG
jgi:hypothetical protein